MILEVRLCANRLFFNNEEDKLGRTYQSTFIINIIKPSYIIICYLNIPIQFDYKEAYLIIQVSNDFGIIYNCIRFQSIINLF